MLRSVRARAALAAAAALAPVLLAGGGAVVLYQRHQLGAATSVVAEDQARAAAQTLDGDGTDVALEAPVTGGEAPLLQVVSSAGAVLTSSPSLVGRGPLLPAPDAGSVRHATLADLEPDEHDAYAVAAVPVDGGGGTYVVAARSLEGVQAATASTTGLLAVGGPVLLVLVSGLGWVLAGRALRPVEEMRRRAAGIGGATLSVRLPEPGTGDEVDRLAGTMNEMLDRLEHAAETQRRFVADASHELRSPLATIRALHEVAARTGSPSPAELGEDVLAETARLERLVADLLLLARADAGSGPSLSALWLDEVVGAACRVPRRVPVSLRRLDRVRVVGHAESLDRALRNLLDNAARHARSAVGMELVAEAGLGVVRITDDGPGIAPDDLERVFERFVRLDEARDRDAGGTGLGLAIAREVATWHGGSLTLTSAGVGTEAVLVVPVAPPLNLD